MSKRGENIRKRKDGRWEGRYKVICNGENKYCSVYGKTYGEVKEKLKHLSEKNKADEAAESKEKTLAEILSMWQEVNKLKHKGPTENKYDYLIKKHIIPDLGHLTLLNLDSLYLNRYIASKLENGRLDKKGGLSSSYVRSIILIINSAIKFAESENLCKPIRWGKLYIPSAEKKNLRVLTIGEQQKLENYIYKNLSLTALGIFISLNAGLRIGEVCALKWSDIDLSEGIISIKSTLTRINSTGSQSKTSLIIESPKTRSSIRDIPICTKLLSLLKDMYSSPSHYVLSDRNEFLSPRTYEYRFHKILKESGIRSINYHTLRHTFATRCVEAGVDVKTLSEVLGHSSVTITLNTYVHTSMEHKRMQLEKISLS